ncbi:MAG: glycerophosphodiester phosphodiesterase family protein [Acidiferrobacterales bacterium]
MIRPYATALLSIFGLLVPYPGIGVGAEPKDLDIQGHRGARGLMPENTLPAFKKALALRVPTLELDIQATKDRELVVYHDPRLNPKLCVYDDGKEVSKQPLYAVRHQELARVDCGRRRNARFRDQQTTRGARIPRLEDVLVLARSADYPVRLSIEIKWAKRKDGLKVREVAEQLVALVKKHDLQARVIVQSFHSPALLAMRDLDPNIPRAILVRNRQEYARAIRESGASILSPRYDRLQAQDVKQFQAEGIAVIPWTPNKPADICRLIDWGVDGLITDYPDRALELSKGQACPSNKP